jgi:hypothetical protein
MLLKQILLDSPEAGPYTCVVSSHSQKVRRVNFLMNASRRNAQGIDLGSSPESSDPPRIRNFHAAMRLSESCGSGDPERAVNVWRYKSVVKEKHAVFLGSGAGRRDRS